MVHSLRVAAGRRWAGSLLLTLVLSAPPAVGQAPSGPVQPVAGTGADRHIAASALQADFAVLRAAYESLHPGLRRYNTEAELESRWTALAREFERDRTLGDAFLALARFTAGLRCGHSYPNFYNQRDSVSAALFRTGPLVPFSFRWLDGRMIVTASVTGDPQLPRGTEVLAINGRPVRQILDSLLPFVRTDGHNRAKQLSLLEIRGSDRYETFDVYYARRFPSNAPQFTLDVRAPGARRSRTITVAAITHADREAARRAQVTPVTPDAEQWEFRFLGPRTAYLRMDGWAMYNTKWDWAAWLNARLDSVAAAGADLIVDIRRNEGGNDIGNLILQRRIRAPLAIASITRRVRYRSIPAALRPYLDTWDRSFDDWGEQAVPADSGFYTLVRDAEEDGSVLTPAGAPLTGKLLVLVGPENSSATFGFALVVQRYRLGTLVGQPTGGNQRGINGGAFYFLRLPGSGLEVDLPLIGIFPTTPAPDAGVTPDVRVTETVADVATGRDRVLERAVAMLRR